MIASVADTHTAIWYLFNDSTLSQIARSAFEVAMDSGDHVGVSSISLAEIVYLSEKGRIPSTTFAQAVEVLRVPENVLTEVPLVSVVVEKMQLIPRGDVPDLPDRIVAAMGLRYSAPVIRRDGKIRAADLQTIW
jgi:PIN domain nuclease of toxin-antitoxin system